MKSVLIYTSGDQQHGLGHVKRQLTLAGELLSRMVRVGFEVPPKTVGHQLIDTWASSRLFTIVNEPSRKHDLIIIDIEHGPSRELLEEARRKFHKVVVVGGVGFPVADQGAIDELVDLQIYQSIAINDGFVSASKHLIGCEYLIINKEYQSLRKVYGSDVFGSNVLVVMGGGDPHGITGVVCEAAKISCNGNGMGVRAVIGPAVGSGGKMLLPDGVKYFYAPPHLAGAFASARCAITALGMTTYEAACVGIPTASIGWSEDHVETAKKLEGAGITVNLGLWNNPNWEKAKSFVEKMSDEHEWRKMYEAGRNLVDGLGVERVAEEIVRLI